MWGLRTGIL